jgi:hypothetical protein
MKKIILSIAMLTSLAAVSYAQSVAEPAPPVKVAPPVNTNATPTPVAVIDKKAPKITFETETIDYGTIENGADGVREFVFKNTGKKPLLITACQGSCGCTVPQWPKEAIAKGKSATIKVTYDTKRTGPFQKTVTVTSNAATPSKIITIKGVVNAAPTTTNKIEEPKKVVEELKH